MRIKVSDGDLVIVGVPTREGQAPSPRAAMEEIANHVSEWIKKRGLQGVTVVAVNNHMPGTITINTLSVNDCFEDQVLNEDKRNP